MTPPAYIANGAGSRGCRHHLRNMQTPKQVMLYYGVFTTGSIPQTLENNGDCQSLKQMDIKCKRAFPWLNPC
jgi:hypothetical protein